MICPKCNKKFSHLSLPFPWRRQNNSRPGFFCPFCGVRLVLKNQNRLIQLERVFERIALIILSGAVYLCTKYFGKNAEIATAVSVSVLAIGLMIMFAFYVERRGVEIDGSYQYKEIPEFGKKPESILKSIVRTLFICFVILGFLIALIYFYITFTS